jgi:hypothetical protein
MCGNKHCTQHGQHCLQTTQWMMRVDQTSKALSCELRPATCITARHDVMHHCMLEAFTTMPSGQFDLTYVPNEQLNEPEQTLHATCNGKRAIVCPSSPHRSPSPQGKLAHRSWWSWVLTCLGRFTRIPALLHHTHLAMHEHRRQFPQCGASVRTCVSIFHMCTVPVESVASKWTPLGCTAKH